MNQDMHSAMPDLPAWLLEPRQVLDVMLDRGMLMYRPYGGPYFLTDERRAASPVFVPDTAVDFLLERGWLTRVDDRAEPEGLFLLTAEGRRTAASRAASR